MMRVLIFLCAFLSIEALAKMPNRDASLTVIISFLLDDRMSNASSSKTVQLRWKRPLERENGAVLNLDEIENYQIRYRKQGADLYRFLLIYPPELSTNLSLIGEPGDRYELSIRVVDKSGVSSEYTQSRFVSFSESQ